MYGYDRRALSRRLLGACVSFLKEPGEKSLLALKKAWKSVEADPAQLLSILLIIGTTLAVLSPEQISFLWAAAQDGGACSSPPEWVRSPWCRLRRRPLAAALLLAVPGTMQITAFLSTLMMVGVVTLPVEIGYFGKKSRRGQEPLRACFSLVWAADYGGGHVMETVKRFIKRYVFSCCCFCSISLCFSSPRTSAENPSGCSWGKPASDAVGPAAHFHSAGASGRFWVKRESIRSVYGQGLGGPPGCCWPSSWALPPRGTALRGFRLHRRHAEKGRQLSNVLISWCAWSTPRKSPMICSRPPPWG